MVTGMALCFALQEQRLPRVAYRMVSSCHSFLPLAEVTLNKEDYLRSMQFFRALPDLLLSVCTNPLENQPWRPASQAPIFINNNC